MNKNKLKTHTVLQPALLSTVASYNETTLKTAHHIQMQIPLTQECEFVINKESADFVIVHTADELITLIKNLQQHLLNVQTIEKQVFSLRVNNVRSIKS